MMSSTRNLLYLVLGMQSGIRNAEVVLRMQNAEVVLGMQSGIRNAAVV